MKNKPMLGMLLAATLSTPFACTAADWSLGADIEADDQSTRSAGLDVMWIPSDRTSFWFSAGLVEGGDGEDSFDSNSFAVGVEWMPFDRVGLALGYDVWDDSGDYDKDTARATLYVGNERARLGLVTELVEGKATAELNSVPRRRTTFDINGNGYGLEAQVSGDRATFYASYTTYEYGRDAPAIETFLDNPGLARRPNVAGLAESGLTAAAALLDQSISLGTDVYFGTRRIGFTLSQLRELVADNETRSLSLAYEWPLAQRWSVELTAGASDSDAFSTVLFAGARVTLHGS